MTFLNVVIGYGIIASVMTTDIDLSKEVISWHLILGWVAVSAPPLLFIWSNRCRHTLLRQLRTPGQRVKNVLMRGAGPDLICLGDFIRLLELRQHDVERHSEVDMPSYGGVIRPALTCRRTGCRRWDCTPGRGGSILQTTNR